MHVSVKQNVQKLNPRLHVTREDQKDPQFRSKVKDDRLADPCTIFVLDAQINGLHGETDAKSHLASRT